MYRKKGGGTFPGETIATGITNADGITLGKFSLIRDISKRLSMETEQRQGQKMEALGNLVGGISHDFNNVLGVISGYAELAMLDDHTKETSEHVEKIVEATERAKSLVGQIMSFSRDTSTEKKPTDLNNLLTETMKLLQVSVPGNVEISVNAEQDIKPVLGSVVQLQQILMNLANNAIGAMKEGGGMLTISLHRERVRNEVNLSHGMLSPGGYSVLTVTDNGTGMSQHTAARVFEPFFTTKKQGEGSGMGMAIVYKLVKSHDARIDMQTALGVGTRIRIYFPELANIKPDGSDSANLPVVKGKGERILLVDDEKELLDSASKLLSSIGYRVEAFSDPNKALEAFSNTPEDYDLLVTDEKMPKLTGVQLVKAVHNLRPKIPVVFCTGYSEVLDQVDIDQSTLGGVVRKPYTLGEISRTIGNVFVT